MVKVKAKENTIWSYKNIYRYNTIAIWQKGKFLHTIPVTLLLSIARERCLISWLWKMHIFPLLKITSKRPGKHFRVLESNSCF